jgi:ribosome-binding factor A
MKAKPKVNRSFGRYQRVEDVIHKVIACALRDHFQDPRVGMMTVMEVKITPDLKFARIYISVLEETQLDQTLDILNRAIGFFRGALAKNVSLRVIPELRFMVDETSRYANHMDRLIASCQPSQ